MDKLVMGYWDCPFCGSTEIRGDVMNCPSCGRARGDVRFYMKGHSEGRVRREHELGDVEYLTEEQAKYVSKNPDWFCSFCESLNSDNVDTCKTCGASRADSESNYFDRLKKQQEKEAAEAAARQPNKQLKKDWRQLWIIIGVIVLAVAGLLCLLLSNTTPGDWKVTGLTWSRTIDIEDYHEAEHSDWSLPAGATLIRTQREIHHYEQVFDHYEYEDRTREVVDHYDTEYSYEDQGNGTFRQVSHRVPVYRTEHYQERVARYRSEPRYQTKYYYTVWEWGHLRDTVLTGDETTEPQWPDAALDSDLQREGKRSETYCFTVTNEKGTSAVYSLTREDWEKLSRDDIIHIVTRRIDSNPHTTIGGNKVTLRKMKEAPLVNYTEPPETADEEAEEPDTTAETDGPDAMTEEPETEETEEPDAA